MPKIQKGFSTTSILIATLVIVVIGIGFYKIATKQDQKVLDLVSEELKKVRESDKKIYQAHGVEFEYNQNLIIKEDTEEEFNKRGNGDFRKNFQGYVTYEPGKFLGAAVVLDKDGNYDKSPFTVWVFENQDNLTVDGWYQKYWYYPFVWGDFTSRGKIDYAPKTEASVSGQIGKVGIIDYQEGKPKFVYVTKDQKIYLFRIIGESGEKILSTITLY